MGVWIYVWEEHFTFRSQWNSVYLSNELLNYTSYQTFTIKNNQSLYWLTQWWRWWPGLRKAVLARPDVRRGGRQYHKHATRGWLAGHLQFSGGVADSISSVRLENGWLGTSGILAGWQTVSLVWGANERQWMICRMYRQNNLKPKLNIQHRTVDTLDD